MKRKERFRATAAYRQGQPAAVKTPVFRGRYNYRKNILCTQNRRRKSA